MLKVETFRSTLTKLIGKSELVEYASECGGDAIQVLDAGEYELGPCN